MPTYRNDTASRITWGGAWIEPGETKVFAYHWPYASLGLTLVSAAPLVGVPVKLSTRANLAAPSSATKAFATLTTDTGKTLTFSAGLIDHEAFAAGNAALAVQGEGLAVQIEANQADALSVTNPTGTNVILVKLASTTASNNTAAKIQTAVQALDPVAGVDVSDMTVAGNTAYNNAPTIGNDVGTASSVVLDFGDDKTLTITSGNPGAWYDALSVEVETAEDNTLAIGEADGVITIQLAADTAASNSAAAIETLLQALTVEGLDMTNFTCAESAEYAAARPAAVKAVGVYDLCSDPEGTTSVGKLTLTAGHGGAAGEAVVRNASFAIAADDNLSAEYDAVNRRVKIYLADETASNNSAANIQIAVRAITGTDLGEYLSQMTVTGDATWTAAPPITFASQVTPVAGQVTGISVSVAEEQMAGGDEAVVAETDLDGAVDATTVTTLDLECVGKFALSVVALSGEASIRLGDGAEEIPVSTSVDYQGTHLWRKVHKLTLTALAAASVQVVQEEVE